MFGSQVTQVWIQTAFLITLVQSLSLLEQPMSHVSFVNINHMIPRTAILGGQQNPLFPFFTHGKFHWFHWFQNFQLKEPYWPEPTSRR